MHTSEQPYFASKSANSFKPLEKEEKQVCFYMVSPFVSVMPIQGWQGLAIWRNRVNFGRDKFTGCLFVLFIDALTDDQRHIIMRGCHYTAPLLISPGSVVCRRLAK